MENKKFDSKYDFTSETVEKKRKFPLVNTIILILLVLAQAACVLAIVIYDPKPQDIIEDYTIYVTPLDNGSLNIEYRFRWTALDTSEDLTWVEIGMPNEYFSVLGDFSDNISGAKSRKPFLACLTARKNETGILTFFLNAENPPPRNSLGQSI